LNGKIAISDQIAIDAVKYCLDAIVEASDRAEDACDQLELATLKSMI